MSHMSARRCWLLAGLSLAALAGLTALPVLAQGLQDPTRPPPESQVAVGTAAAAETVKPGPQLQSVLNGVRGRDVAVIDGQTLRRGDKIDGAVLIKVGKDNVTLRRGGKDEVLTLFPKKQ